MAIKWPKMAAWPLLTELCLAITLVKRSKLLDFIWPLVATWTTMDVRTQNHSQTVGTCPTHQPQLVSEN